MIYNYMFLSLFERSGEVDIITNENSQIIQFKSVTEIYKALLSRNADFQVSVGLSSIRFCCTAPLFYNLLKTEL